VLWSLVYANSVRLDISIYVIPAFRQSKGNVIDARLNSLNQVNKLRTVYGYDTRYCQSIWLKSYMLRHHDRSHLQHDHSEEINFAC
jgi:hypothetical protein